MPTGIIHPIVYGIKRLYPSRFFIGSKKIGSYRLIVRSSLAVYNDSIYQKSDFVKSFF